MPSVNLTKTNAMLVSMCVKTTASQSRPRSNCTLNPYLIRALFLGPHVEIRRCIHGSRSIHNGNIDALSTPHLWFPGARALRRRIIMHVGPTNSVRKAFNCEEYWNRGVVTYEALHCTACRARRILPSQPSCPPSRACIVVLCDSWPGRHLIDSMRQARHAASSRGRSAK